MSRRPYYLLAAVAVFVLVLVPVAKAQEGSLSGRVAKQVPTLMESLKKWEAVQLNIGQLIADAKPGVKNKAAEIQTIPAPAGAQPQIISAEQKSFLVSKVKDFTEHAKSEETLFGRLAIGCIIASLILSLVGAIFGVYDKSKASAIAGFIVTAIIGLSSAYPLNSLANFYRGLEAQASALQVECELKQPFTADSYNSAANQLKLLYLYESKRPGFANYDSPVQSLATELQTVKTSSETVEKTRNLM